jgi:hypothetical protein
MERVSHEEYQTWKAYYSIEPFGTLREDFRAGQICATMARIVSDGKTEFTATDFIPTIDSIEAEKEAENVANMNEQLAKGFASLRKAAKGFTPKRVNI